MRFALNENKEKIQPEYSGQRALCPGCKKEVTGKIYSNKKNHWAHISRDCDSWYEPISDWHLKWQNIFPKDNQEITLYDEKTSEFHRADVRLDNGIVIEVQNSPINIHEVSEREKFYNKKGLIWILNAQNLIPKSSFVNFIMHDNCKVKISFSTEYYSQFDTDDIISDFIKNKYHSLKFLEKANTEESIQYKFNSNWIGDIESSRTSLISSINSLNWKYSRINHNDTSTFEVDIQPQNNKYKLHKFLAKTQWRKFIDEMKSPVFLDNVTNLDSDYLY